MKKIVNKSETADLRKKAERLLKAKIGKSDLPSSETDKLKLIHELQVHQIELELQNEELRLAKERAEIATEKYIELYDFAPNGYFTLLKGGNIIKLNICGARMLGKERSRLINSLFGFFVTNDTLPIFNHFLEEVFSTLSQKNCEVLLSPIDSLPLHIHLTGVISENGTECLLTAVDITERKQAHDMVQQTRQNYETFFNTIDELLFVLDEQGNIIHTNAAVIDRLGYTSEELIGKPVLMVHPSEHREEAGRIVGEMLSGLTEFCPVPVITKTGVCIPVETRVTAGHWDGKPALFGVTKDISQITLSEEKFSKVFYLNPSACGLSDLVTGEHIEVNEAFCLLLGFDKVEVIGKTAEELGIITAEAKQTILEKIHNNKISNIEADLRAKDGSIRHVLISAENIHIQEKQLRYTVVHDITARKLAEASMQEAFDRLKKITSMVPGVVYQYRLRPDGTSCFPFASDGIKDIYRVNPDEVREDASKVFATLHPDDYEGVAASIYTSANNLTPWQYEYRVKFDDGATRTLYGNAIPQKDEDGSVLWHGFITDITRRKQTEEALQEAYKSLSDIMDAAIHTSIISTDINGIITVFSRGSEKMLGYSAEELVGKNTPACFHLESEVVERGIQLSRELGRTIEGFEAFVAKARIQEHEERTWTYLCKNGSTIQVNLIVSSIRNNNGDITGFLGIANDITESRQAENTIRLNEVRYKALISASIDGFWVVNDDYRLLEVNEAYCSMTGYTEKELLTMKVSDLEAGETLEDIHKRSGIIIMNGWARFEGRHRCADGSIINVEVKVVYIADMKLTLCFIQDISVKKNAEKVLLEASEDRYKRVVDNIQGSLIIDDVNRNIVYVNSKFLEIYGAASDEVLGKKWENIIVPEDRDKLIDLHTKMIRGENKGFKVEFQAFNKAGTKLWYEGFAVPIFENGAATGMQAIVYDIGERKIFENRLIESEDRYKRITEGITDYLYIVKVKEGKAVETFHNDSCFAVTGYTAKEFETEPYLWIEMVVPEDRELVSTRIKGILAGEEELTIQHRIIRKDGTIRWIRDTLIPKYDFEGSLISYDGVVRDITERKLAEKELRLSESKNRAILEANPDLMFIINSEGIILDYRVQFVNELYAPPDSIIGNMIEDMLPPEICSAARANIKAALESGERQVFEYSLLLSAGERDYEAHISRMDDRQVVLFARDITERKQSEKTLRESEERYRTVADYTYDWEYWISPDRGFKYVSPSCKSVTGYSVEEFIQNPSLIVDIIYPDDRIKWEEHIFRQFQNNSDIEEIEIRFYNKSGILRWLDHVSIPVFNDSGIFLGWRGSNRDITERKLIEKQKKEAEDIIHKLSEVNELKTRFISMVSHEFRTPLTSILSSADFIAMSGEKGDPAKRDKHFSRIRDNVNFLTNMLDNILFINRNEKEKENNQYSAHKTLLADLCTEIFENIKISYPGISASIEINLSTETYNIDANKMKNVLNNLLTNAFKFSIERGKVNFSVSAKENQLYFEIADTGMGIPSKEQENIFNSFSRMSNSHHIKGTGLGLNIVKTLVEQMNGNISFTSKESEGTTFTVIIPISKA